MARASRPSQRLRRQIGDIDGGHARAARVAHQQPVAECSGSGRAQTAVGAAVAPSGGCGHCGRADVHDDRAGSWSASAARRAPRPASSVRRDQRHSALTSSRSTPRRLTATRAVRSTWSVVRVQRLQPADDDRRPPGSSSSSSPTLSRAGRQRAGHDGAGAADGERAVDPQPHRRIRGRVRQPRRPARRAPRAARRCPRRFAALTDDRTARRRADAASDPRRAPRRAPAPRSAEVGSA